MNFFAREPLLRYSYKYFFNRSSLKQNYCNSVFWFAYARQALIEGFKALDLHKGDKILYPETICDVTLTAPSQLGLKVEYYPLNEDLSPHWESLDRLVDNKTKVFFLVHYFGIPQDIMRALDWCKEKGIFLVEDNAHGYGATFQNKLIGTFGRIGISSIRKITGVLNGAILWINNNDIRKDSINTAYPLEPISMRRVIKSIAYSIADSCSISTRLFRKEPCWGKMDPLSEQQYFPFGIDAITHKAIRAIDFNNNAVKRQIIYRQWSHWCKARGMLSVFTNIPEGSTPYCFPCYAVDHTEQLRWLKWGWNHHIEIFPWPSLPQAQRRIDSRAYKRWKRLLCFPIHHEINFEKLMLRLELSQ